MKVAVFVIGYTHNKREFGIPHRIRFFHELTQHAKKQKIDLVVLPGGFFRTNSPKIVINALKCQPPQVTVLVGCDNMNFTESKVWVVASNGKIVKELPEAWKSSYKFSKTVLNSINDRRFSFKNKIFSIFSCGDILIDNELNAGRKPPIFNSKAAFVLSHFSAKGRSFAPHMRNLEIPVFLSHHVKWPYDTVSFAYNGNYNARPKPIAEFWNEKTEGVEWMARVYPI